MKIYLKAAGTLVGLIAIFGWVLPGFVSSKTLELPLIAILLVIVLLPGLYFLWKPQLTIGFNKIKELLK